MAFETLISRDRIHQRIQEMGAQIARDYADHELVVLCVLKGGVFFMTDLVRAIPKDLAIDFIQVSSYGNQQQSSGVVTLLKEPQIDMRGKGVLIVEDIIDSGMSMREISRYIEGHGATIVRTATLLDKTAARKVPFQADYVGFPIDPHFVIGYGLDLAEKYRNIPEVQIYSEK